MKILTKKFWSEGTGSLLLAVFFALLIRWAFFEANVIPTESMLPTLLINDHIFVNKIVYGMRVPFTEKWFFRFNEPKRGEVVVFKSPEDEGVAFIKRIIGIPGDRIYYENGNLYVNDQLIEKKVPIKLKSDKKWLDDSSSQLLSKSGEKKNLVHWEEKLGSYRFSVLLDNDKIDGFKGPFEVPKDSYFVMGDNRDMSWDSRYWKKSKFVPRKNLLGRAMFVWLSCKETFKAVSFLCKPQSLRWDRFFHTIHHFEKEK